jgi:translation initiation factor 3 subunit D
MTDVAAAAIMSASKAVYSWDLVLKKVQNMVFVQKRDEENMLDWQTVAETEQQDMQPLDIDGVNGARFIMKEAAQTQTDFIYHSQN